ncbi:hypothetical protein N8878_05445 [Psychromonas sp.]|nr:hypothetical protein [Psychromonas sp.]
MAENNKSQTSINEVQKNNIEQSPYKKLITISALIFATWGGISTAGHFIGYSFLQGKIAGHGLGEHELTLNSFESIMQAGYATKAMFNEFYKDVTNLFGLDILGLFTVAIILGCMLLVFLWDPKKSKEKGDKLNNLSKKFDALPRWLRIMIIYPTISSIGVMYLMFLILLVFYTLWVNLTIAHAVGYRAGQQDIAVKHCVAIDSLDKKSGYIASCTMFYDVKNKLYIGKIIHSNKHMTLLQTNTESVLFDKDRKIITCSPILDLSLKAEQVKNNCTET